MWPSGGVSLGLRGGREEVNVYLDDGTFLPERCTLKSVRRDRKALALATTAFQAKKHRSMKAAKGFGDDKRC